MTRKRTVENESEFYAVFKADMEERGRELLAGRDNLRWENGHEEIEVPFVAVMKFMKEAKEKDPKCCCCCVKGKDGDVICRGPCC